MRPTPGSRPQSGSRGRVLPALLAFSLGIHASAGPACAGEAGRLDPSRLGWHVLVFESNGLLSSVEARIELRQQPVSAVHWKPMPHATAPLHHPEGETLMALRARVHMRMGVARKLREETVWLDPRDGRVFQQLRYEGGDAPSRKYYRFSDRQIFRFQFEPANSGELQEPSNWSQTNEASYAYAGGGRGCDTIIESTTLLYIASVVDLASTPTPWALCVFSRKRIYPVTVSAVGQRTFAVGHLIGNPPFGQRSESEVRARIFEISVYDDSVDSESFYLLGLRAPIRLFVTEKTRIPVRVAGKIPKYGEGVLNLREMLAAPRPRSDGQQPGG